MAQRKAGVDVIRRSLMSILSEKAPPCSINFGIGEPTYPIPENLKEKIIGIVKADSEEYGHVAGLADFREFLADWYSDKGLCFETNAQSVVATCGVTEAVFASIMSLVNSGDEVIYPDPGYVLYEPAIKMCHAVPVPLRLDRKNAFDVNSSTLENLITKKTKAVIINSPSNPTAKVLRRKRLKEIAEICNEKCVTIISDEIYEHIVYESMHHSVSEFTDNAIICSGISKLFRLAGWRLGWCVAKDALMKNIIKSHQYIAFRAPTISQKVAQFALSQKNEMRKMAGFYRKKRDIFIGQLKDISGIKYSKPEATFFLYVDFSEYGDDWQLALKFLKNGVITAPSTGQGAGFGTNGKGFIRLSYTSENEKLKEGIKRMKEVLLQLKN